MYYKYSPADQQLNVPIGYPAGNTQIYLLDNFLLPVPEGVEGEMYISGAGIAKGYYGRQDLTAAAFVPNPFNPGALMYRTQDTAV